METAFDILNKIFTTKVLDKKEYRVAIRVIRYFRPDIPWTTLRGDNLKPIANLVDIPFTILKNYYNLDYRDVFGRSKSQEFYKYRKMSFCSMIDVMDLDRYTVNRSFSKYRSREAVYMAIKEFRKELETYPDLRGEYEVFKGYIQEEYNKRYTTDNEND